MGDHRSGRGVGRGRRYLRGCDDFDVTHRTRLSFGFGESRGGSSRTHSASSDPGAKSSTSSPESKSSSPTSGTSGASGQSTSEGGTTYYLATGGNYVDFIEWNDNGGDLSGTAREVSLSGSPPASTTTKTFQILGSLSGASLNLNFDHGNPVSTKIANGKFTIAFPQPNGTTAPVVFQSAGPPEYITAIRALFQQIQANQTGGSSQALQTEEQTINADATAVSGDISTLSTEEASTQSDVQGTPSDLQDESDDLSSAHDDLQQTQSDAGSGDSSTCADASIVSSDAATVESDSSTIAQDASSVAADLSTTNGLRAAIAALNADFSQLQTDGALLPGYQPPGAPDALAVLAAVSTANGDVNSAVSTTNGYIDQANGDLAKAYQYASQAFQIGNCGSPPTTPSALQHIS